MLAVMTGPANRSAGPVRRPVISNVEHLLSPGNDRLGSIAEFGER